MAQANSEVTSDSSKKGGKSSARLDCERRAEYALKYGKRDCAANALASARAHKRFS